MSEVVLSARHITKKFPGVVALRDVSFDLRAGEIHALCGENGAGKSTLIKLLSGLHPFGSYEGELCLGGELARFHTIADAQKAGLAVIYQELALVEDMTVAENIFLGQEPRRGVFIDWNRIYREARELLGRFKVAIDPAARCGSLGIGQRQLVEIVKALSRDSRILILDEPTAALAEHEVQILLGILREVRARGISAIYISHKLDEVFTLADRITVLRDGSTVATADTAQTNMGAVVRHMVGREIADLFPPRVATREMQTPILRVENLTVIDPASGAPALEEISFTLAPGEVLGIGGLMGAGRTELLMHLFGAWGRRAAGSVELCGAPLRADAGPAEALRRGLALVTEDRRRDGLVLEQNVAFNLSLASLRRLTQFGLVDENREFSENDAAFQNLQIKAPNLEAVAGKLSGGNQQKVVLGKMLMTGPRVIFLDEPTRGIDVGAKLEIYQIIRRLTAEGRAVVLVSSELPELIGLSDRILMLHEGRISRAFSSAEAHQEALMSAAMGRA